VALWCNGGYKARDGALNSEEHTTGGAKREWAKGHITVEGILRGYNVFWRVLASLPCSVLSMRNCIGGGMLCSISMRNVYAKSLRE
jgi:hypothetical protein